MKYLILPILLLFLACNESKPSEVARRASHEKESHHGDHSTDHNPSNIQMNKTDFDKLVNAFESSDRAAWQKPDLVIKMMGDLSDRKVGDIGAGTGYFAFRLAPKAKEVVAIDVDERFIKYMQEELPKDKVQNLTTRLVAYDDPELKDGEFDVLLIVNTYHHFNDKVAYLKKCMKGLSPEGKVFIVDFKKEEVPIGPPIDHKLAPEEVKADLAKAGFENFTIDSTSLIYQYVVVGTK